MNPSPQAPHPRKQIEEAGDAPMSSNSGERVRRSIGAVDRDGLEWNDVWCGDDRGLIAAWEAGRRMAEKRPDLARAARRGELVTLPWKGGIDPDDLAATAARKAERERRTGTKSKTKPRQRYGPLLYLAMWQGLRGDDLDVTLNGETRLTCTASGVAVTFTSEVANYADS